MTNLITGIIGIAMVVAFAGFMVIWVPARPLIVIFVSVLLLLLIDFIQSLRGNGANSKS